MNAVAALYQKGRTLNESLAVLKAAMSCRGLCTPQVLPPLKELSESQLEKLRQKWSGCTCLTEMKSARPILGLTMGDPAGIGPEICLRALREPAVLARCTPVLFGDAWAGAENSRLGEQAADEDDARGRFCRVRSSFGIWTDFLNQRTAYR